MFGNWILYHSENSINLDFKSTISFNSGSFHFVSDTRKADFLINHEIGEFIIVFGYLMPRLNTKIHGNTILKLILNGLKREGASFVNQFKGNFVLIASFNKQFLILNDQFGINKFFFVNHSTNYIASNNISYVIAQTRAEISVNNIVKYYAFNYFVNGSTVFKNIHYAEGGTCHKLGNSIEYGKYFSITEFLDDKRQIYNQYESIEKATVIWKELMQQYIDFFKGKSISQTLTAGIDSRLILAGFRSNNFNPLTFTFGRADSMDVVHAKKIAKKLNLKHDHLYPDGVFFNDFAQFANNVIQKSSGMATIYRGHRLYAYNSMKNSYDVLFFGFIGSEIIRGLYPDALTLPKVVSDYWLHNQLNKNQYFPESWIYLDESELKNIHEEILNLDFINRPDVFLFKVMIPLHFGQDIVLNEKLGILTVAPFWDIDFLCFQKHTLFFIDNSRKKDFAQLGHYSRRNGPYFSTRLIRNLDIENARLSLGKGYSPLDYSRSLYYAAFKFFIYKRLYASKYRIPNFSYQEWFKTYVTRYLENENLSIFNDSRQKIIYDLKNQNGTDEYSFLPFVKIINISLIINNL